MKKVLCGFLVLGFSYVVADVGQPLTTPGEPVVAGTANSANTGNKPDTGYIIVTQSTKANREKCLDKKSCYERCALNQRCYLKCAQNKGNISSKVPCVSNTQITCKNINLQNVTLSKLQCLCYQACDETANYETAHRDDTTLPLTRLNGFEGTCSTIQNCIAHHTDDLGWPFQCANIFCAYIDPSDGEVRNIDEQIPDKKPRKTLFKKEKSDKVPQEFEQMGSEY